MSRADPDPTVSDQELIHLIGAALDADEPMPPWAAEFAAGAFAWRDVDVNLAELLHDSELGEAVVLRDDSSLRFLVFQAGDITLDVEHGPGKLSGAVSPPGRYRVAINDGGPDRAGFGAPTVLTDDAGMFEMEAQVRGPVRFVVSDPDGQVAILSPWITL